VKGGGGFGLPHLVDRGDVRVIEGGEHLRLPLEAGEAVSVVGKGFGQHLDRDLTVEPGVGGAVDLAHPALAQLGGDLVGAEARADHGRPHLGLRHGRRDPDEDGWESTVRS